MPQDALIKYIKQLKREAFTTRELASFSGKSVSLVNQGLEYLKSQGAVVKIYRGVWAEVTAKSLSPFSVAPFLFSGRQVYVSFISALHLHGIIEQIPQTVTVASLGHSRTLRTQAGTFVVHHLAPDFFKGFDWYKGSGDFLIAEPEKALVDCLYLSGRKGKRFAHFPELHFGPNFSFKKCLVWARDIRDPKLRVFVVKGLKQLEQG